MLKRLQPTETVALPDLPIGWSLLRYAVLSDGALAIVADNQGVAATPSWGEPGFEPNELFNRIGRARARVFTLQAGGLALEFETQLEEFYPLIDRLPDGRWVMADTRANRSTNARLLSPDGQVIERFMLGDAIEHMKVDSQGRIWVGWFDEAAWDYGIACFDQRGTLIWSHNGSGNPDSICDCYALNVAGEEAWACPYTDFPVLRLSPNGLLQRWTNDVSGARAIGVWTDHLLLAGGYEPEEDRVVLLRLEPGCAVAVSSWLLDVPKTGWEFRSLLDGRGQAIHLVRGGEWRRWDVPDVMARVEVVRI